MSLERRDCRFKLPAHLHDAGRLIAEQRKVDLGEWFESLVAPVVEREVHAAIELAQALQRQGIAGNFREKPGVAGNGRE